MTLGREGAGNPRAENPRRSRESQTQAPNPAMGNRRLTREAYKPATRPTSVQIPKRDQADPPVLLGSAVEVLREATRGHVEVSPLRGERRTRPAIP